MRYYGVSVGVFVSLSQSIAKLLKTLIYLFRLSEDRVGDICNACVLLVKRWKKLPHGSKKNWNHVREDSDNPTCLVVMLKL